jgi:hypothetical protein
MPVMWHHNAAARMTDVYCINSSVADLDGKRGRTIFKKEVNAYEREAPQFFSEFPVRLFANWYTHLPVFKDVVGKGKQTGTEDGGFDVWQLLIYKSTVASLDITCCSIFMSA